MELKMKRPELEDRELLERYLAHADTRSCEMTFGNIYLWSRFYNTGFAIVEDNLIFGEVDGVYSYTFPVGPGDKKKTIDVLMSIVRKMEKFFNSITLPERISQNWMNCIRIVLRLSLTGIMQIMCMRLRSWRSSPVRSITARRIM